MRRWLLRALLLGVALFVIAQVIPYGRKHANPAVAAEPRWAGAQTRELAQRACFDCHSNLTTWPWYSNVAPVSWLVYGDVQGGREHLNFSQWNTPQEASPQEVASIVRGGEMPPTQYTLLHPHAKLSAAEKDALARGLEATLRRSPPGR